MAAAEPRTGAPGALRVAVLGGDPERRDRLRSGLRQAGFSVPFEGPVAGYLKRAARLVPPDLLLVGLEHDGDDDLGTLDALLERHEPMLFSDALYREDSPAALERLAGKIHQAVAGWQERRPPAPPEPGPDDFPVWVLGASFGGPEMVKRFLQALPGPPPGALLLAQHIGAGFAEVLAAQLDRCCPFPVLPIREGGLLAPGQVHVAPVPQRLRITRDNRFRLEAESAPEDLCQPSIDAVMEEVARHFPGRCGAVVFSGMGDDGRRGCEAVGRAGGTVWAQDSASCAIDSMPLNARATGWVSRVAPPEALAAELGQRWQALPSAASG